MICSYSWFSEGQLLLEKSMKAGGVARSQSLGALMWARGQYLTNQGKNLAVPSDAVWWWW